MTLFPLDEYTEKPAYGYDDYGDDLAELLEELDDIGAEFVPHVDAFTGPIPLEPISTLEDTQPMTRHLLANDLPDAPPYIPARHERHDLMTYVLMGALGCGSLLMWSGILYCAWKLSGGAG